MRKPASIEWPTVFLTLGVYGSWMAITFFHALLPALFVAAAGAWLIAWHSSLQHEILHGHPTPWKSVNSFLASAPLSLWLPYHVYERSHVDHHRAEVLADPANDPESYYWTKEAWLELNPLARTLVRLQMTFVGRLLIGPAWNVSRMAVREFAILRNNPREGLINWAAHVFGCAIILLWVVGVCKMSLWFYLFCIVYPGTSLSLVRSFAEHRADKTEGELTAIVENARVFGVLFLFNNLHVVHHSRPDLPWYKIPACYKEHRQSLVARENARVYQGYFEIARRYFLMPFADPVHPFNREEQNHVTG